MSSPNIKKFSQFLEEKKQFNPNAADAPIKVRSAQSRYKEPPLAGVSVDSNTDYKGMLAVRPESWQDPSPYDDDPAKIKYVPAKSRPYFPEAERERVWTADEKGDNQAAFGQYATPGISPETSSLGEPASGLRGAMVAGHKPFSSESKPGHMRFVDPESRNSGLGYMNSPNVRDTGSLTRPADKLSKKYSKTEAFLNKTAKMSDVEFINYYLSEANNNSKDMPMVHDLHGRPFTPKPSQAINYVAHLCEHPDLMCRLVRALKRNGHFPKLVKELMEHPESFAHLVDMMDEDEDGKGICDKLARTMHDKHMKFKADAGLLESVADPLDDDEEDVENLLDSPEAANLEEKPEEGESEDDEMPKDDEKGDKNGGEGDKNGGEEGDELDQEIENDLDSDDEDEVDFDKSQMPDEGEDIGEMKPRHKGKKRAIHNLGGALLRQPSFRDEIGGMM